MIKPHRGVLINKILPPEKNKEVLTRKDDLSVLEISKELVKDVKNIARGVYSPLGFFLGEKDFKRVVSEMRLSDGTVWPIPIVLDIEEKDYRRIKNEKEIILVDSNKTPIALLKDIQIYSFNKDFLAQNVFGTQERRHPGVETVYKMGKYLVGGEIELLDGSQGPFPEYNFAPVKTRKIFQERGWDSIVAFQTRNVPHLGHEFLQKQALKEVDGLFVQPVIGEKKLEDFKDEYILASYEILIENYYPKNRVVLGILPLKMRYAGPREAVFHALIRKNFGCTHFIVGRDHAGVGNYYPPFAAQEIFDGFKKREIGIQILKYPEVVWCSSCQRHTFINECPEKERVFFSGTKLREKIKNKEQPPFYIIRPKVFNFLANSYNSLVDAVYKKINNEQKGFVLWFTGLSQSGKTTTADKVYEILKGEGMRVERLDGDIVRQHLSKDLGFSKEDRDENIRRVGFISRLLSKNDVGVIASFISPFRVQRDGVKKEVKNFIEIFCNCPLQVCEERDTKGLYQKAKRGEIENFTGISHPYEEPESPDIELKTGEESIEECVEKIVNYLRENGFITTASIQL